MSIEQKKRGLFFSLFPFPSNFSSDGPGDEGEEEKKDEEEMKEEEEGKGRDEESQDGSRRGPTSSLIAKRLSPVNIIYLLVKQWRFGSQ